MDSVSQAWKTERWLGPQWQQGRANALQILLCQGVANTGLPIQPAESMCCALETEKEKSQQLGFVPIPTLGFSVTYKWRKYTNGSECAVDQNNPSTQMLGSI